MPPLRAGWVIAGYALRESLRRRVLGVVAILTGLFLALYAVGTAFAFHEASGFAAGAGVDDTTLTGATVLGLALFAILFLGAVLGTFLTLGIVRGDAEVGLLQPLAARPLDRGTILIARFAGAGAVTAGYVLVVTGVAIAITAIAGGWTPDRIVPAMALLAFAAVMVCAVSVLASVWLGGTAQGIAVLMTYGAGLTAGLLGQIGDGLGSETLVDISKVISWALPFEALYQAALGGLTADTSGITGFVLSLGPFGGAREGGPGLVLWSLAFAAALLAIAVAGFRRRDL